MIIYIKLLSNVDAAGNQISFGKEAAIHFFEAPSTFLDKISNWAIDVCMLSNPASKISLPLQPATDYRFSSQLNTFVASNGETIEDGDLLYFEKAANGYGVKIIKKGMAEYSVYASLVSPYKRQTLIYSMIPQNTALPASYPLQQIYYGAPGTGKSFEINRITKIYDVIRTTFHPDSDYSTFVGAYKPTMLPVRKTVIIGQDEKPVNPMFGSSPFEDKIAYAFVKQAFLKAYLAAWKKYSNGPKTIMLPSATPAKDPTKFRVKKDIYTILSVSDIDIITDKTFSIPKNSFLTSWKECWKSGTFNISSGINGSTQNAVCKWIADNEPMLGVEDFDKGWQNLIEATQKNRVAVSGIKQDYEVISATEDEATIFCQARKTKDDAKEVFEGKSYSNAIQGGIDKVLKSYDENDFEVAWGKLRDAVNQWNGHNNNIDEDGTVINSEEMENDDHQDTISCIDPQFLVIEEINRGNCAQIFGDLFQLLDRGVNGFSCYPIEADSDIQQEIARCFAPGGEYELGAFEIEGVIDGYTSNYGKTLSEDVKEGRVMLLPNNLYIWATMNTSDQSLFPIDSAFKRRWDWKYIKIKEGKDEQGNILDWQISCNEKNTKWWDFLQKVNEIIASMTSSADKQLGFFFCKAKNGVIDEDTFVSKVLFYLWNDVFKDTCFEDGTLFRYKVTEDGKDVEKDLTFPDFYDEDGEKVNTERVADFIGKVMAWQKSNEENQ